MKSQNVKLKKRFMSLILGMVIAVSVFLSDSSYLQVQAKLPVSGSGFNNLKYQDWCQIMSKYSGMRASGCRVVTYTKLLHEAKYTQVGTPDDFYEWGKKNGFYKNYSLMELSTFGQPLIKYVQSQKGTISLIRTLSLTGLNKKSVANVMLRYMEQGYYCILSCGSHTSYVGRKESLLAKTPILLDSSYSSNKNWTGNYQNTVPYLKYSANYFTHLRVYKVSTAPKKTSSQLTGNPRFTIYLNQRNGQDKLKIFEKYGKGFYSNAACRTLISKIAVPVRKGYVFDGYYTGVDGKGTKCIDSNGKFLVGKTSFRKDVNLYANWIPVFNINLKLPATVPLNKSTNIEGTITSPQIIRTATVYIKDSRGNLVGGSQNKITYKPNSRRIDLISSPLNMKLRFGKITTRGTYTLVLQLATDKEKTTRAYQFNAK